MKMEYDTKKLDMEERVAEAKARAKVLSTFSDVSLQKYKKEYHIVGKRGHYPLFSKIPPF